MWVPRSMPAYFSKTDCLSVAARRHLTRCAVSFVAPPWQDTEQRGPGSIKRVLRRRRAPPRKRLGWVLPLSKPGRVD
jgi:hypothetical protein